MVHFQVKVNLQKNFRSDGFLTQQNGSTIFKVESFESGIWNLEFKPRINGICLKMLQIVLVFVLLKITTSLRIGIVDDSNQVRILKLFLNKTKVSDKSDKFFVTLFKFFENK